MTLLSLTNRMIQTVRQRRAIRSMTGLDDRTLADIGLLRTDIYASLARPSLAGPSKVKKDAFCRWHTVASRFRLGAEPVACC